MRQHNSELWPVAKKTWRRKWGIWLVGELQKSKDLQEMLDILDI